MSLRNSKARRDRKRVALAEDMQGVCDQMANVTPIEVSVRKIAEALVFILEDTCKKKI